MSFDWIKPTSAQSEGTQGGRHPDSSKEAASSPAASFQEMLRANPGSAAEGGAGFAQEEGRAGPNEQNEQERGDVPVEALPWPEGIPERSVELHEMGVERPNSGVLHEGFEPAVPDMGNRVEVEAPPVAARPHNIDVSPSEGPSPLERTNESMTSMSVPTPMSPKARPAVDVQKGHPPSVDAADLSDRSVPESTHAGHTSRENDHAAEGKPLGVTLSVEGVEGIRGGVPIQGAGRQRLPDVTRAAEATSGPIPHANPSAFGQEARTNAWVEAPVPMPARDTHVHVFEQLQRLQDLVQRFDNHIVSMMVGRQQNMVITLIPPSLGRVVIRLKEAGNHGLRVEIGAEHAAVRDVLLDHEAGFRSRLQARGYELNGFDVREERPGRGANQRREPGASAQKEKGPASADVSSRNASPASGGRGPQQGDHDVWLLA